MFLKNFFKYKNIEKEKRKKRPNCAYSIKDNIVIVKIE